MDVKLLNAITTHMSKCGVEVGVKEAIGEHKSKCKVKLPEGLFEITVDLVKDYREPKQLNKED